MLSAAVANIKAGRDAEAAALLERLQSGQERIFRMDSYVRSFFLRAQIHERRGDAAAARAQYTRFLGFWRGGDFSSLRGSPKRSRRWLPGDRGGADMTLDSLQIETPRLILRVPAPRISTRWPR